MFMLQIINNLDLSILNFLASRHSQALDVFFSTITNLGHYLFLGFLLMGITLYFLPKNFSSFFIGAWAGFLGSAASVFILKELIQRPRPQIGGFIYDSEFSFPSGHAAMSLFFYALLIILGKINNLSSAQRKVLNIFCVILIIVIGFSRMYLNVHYFSDILGGYAIGLIWLAISQKLIKN